MAMAGWRLISRFVRLALATLALLLFCLYFGGQPTPLRDHRDEASQEKGGNGVDGDGVSVSGCESSEAILDYTDFGAKDVRALFYSLNEKACIRNEKRFHPSSTKNAVKYVLLVMVHNRVSYLQHLIDSISKLGQPPKATNSEKSTNEDSSLSHINETLVIFSHDIFDADVFHSIEKITQFRVMQIGFPFSSQIFPDSFPGTDPNDCPRDISKRKAQKMDCLNAEFPDSYGHYREAKFAALKHHWWWKLNYVMKNVVGSVVASSVQVVLLEEDYYLAPDALSVVLSLRRVASQECPQCQLLQLGDYAKLPSSSKPPHPHNFATLRVDEYLSSRNNMALVLNKTVYEGVLNDVTCGAGAFCEYDDYNWDWSLNHLSLSCLRGNSRINRPLLVLLPTLPRVLHIGQCGVHTSKRQVERNGRCSAVTLIENFVSVFEEYHNNINKNERAEMKLIGGKSSVSSPTKGLSVLKKNGGWGDPRDKRLCLKMALEPPMSSSALSLADQKIS